MTSNIDRRLKQHQSAFFPDSYTSNRRPVNLEFFAEFSDFDYARSIEIQIKKWSKAKKEALIRGDYEQLKNLAKKKFD